MEKHSTTDGAVFFTPSKLVVWRCGRSYSGKRTLWNVVTGSKLFWLAASCWINCWLDGMQIRRASLWMQRALQSIFHRIRHGMTFSLMHLDIYHIIKHFFLEYSNIYGRLKYLIIIIYFIMARCPYNNKLSWYQSTNQPINQSINQSINGGRQLSVWKSVLHICPPKNVTFFKELLKAQ